MTPEIDFTVIEVWAEVLTALGSDNPAALASESDCGQEAYNEGGEGDGQSE